MRESEEHIKLKEKAKEFLKSLGFEKIVEEYPTGVIYVGDYFGCSREAWVDVAGFIGGRREDGLDGYPTSWDRIALVECGDTPEGKLRTLARHFDEVYHLPYNGKIKKVKREPVKYWWEIE